MGATEVGVGRDPLVDVGVVGLPVACDVGLSPGRGVGGEAIVCVGAPPVGDSWVGERVSPGARVGVGSGKGVADGVGLAAVEVGEGPPQ